MYTVVEVNKHGETIKEVNTFDRYIDAMEHVKLMNIVMGRSPSSASPYRIY